MPSDFMRNLGGWAGLTTQLQGVKQGIDEQKEKKQYEAALGGLQRGEGVPQDIKPSVVQRATSDHRTAENQRQVSEQNKRIEQDQKYRDTLNKYLYNKGISSLNLEAEDIAIETGIPVHEVWNHVAEISKKQLANNQAFEQYRMHQDVQEYQEFKTKASQAFETYDRGDKFRGMNAIQEIVNNTPNGYSIQFTSEDKLNLYRDEGGNEDKPLLINEGMSLDELRGFILESKFQDYEVLKKAYREEVSEINYEYAKQPMEFFDEEGRPYKVRYGKSAQYYGAPHTIEMASPDGKLIGKWEASTRGEVFKEFMGSDQLVGLYGDQGEAKRAFDMEISRRQDRRAESKNIREQEKHDERGAEKRTSLSVTDEIKIQERVDDIIRRGELDLDNIEIASFVSELVSQGMNMNTAIFSILSEIIGNDKNIPKEDKPGILSRIWNWLTGSGGAKGEGTSAPEGEEDLFTVVTGGLGEGQPSPEAPLQSWIEPEEGEKKSLPQRSNSLDILKREAPNVGRAIKEELPPMLEEAYKGGKQVIGKAVEGLGADPSSSSTGRMTPTVSQVLEGAKRLKNTRNENESLIQYLDALDERSIHNLASKYGDRNTAIESFKDWVKSDPSILQVSIIEALESFAQSQ